MIWVFVSTVKWDPISAAIRWATLCDWSHTGFYDDSTGMTFSAMHDRGGVAWRKPDPRARMMLLEVPRADEALQIAEQWAGLRYDTRDILGIILRRDWKSPDAYICDRVVFKAFELLAAPLLNHTFIPMEHLAPDDVLKSLSIKSHRMLQRE